MSCNYCGKCFIFMLYLNIFFYIYLRNDYVIGYIRDLIYIVCKR